MRLRPGRRENGDCYGCLCLRNACAPIIANVAKRCNYVTDSREAWPSGSKVASADAMGHLRGGHSGAQPLMKEKGVPRQIGDQFDVSKGSASRRKSLSAKPAQRRMISLLQGKRRTFRAQDSFLGSDVPAWTDDPGTWPQHQKAFELVRTADLDPRCSFARSVVDSGRVACEEQVVLERRKRPGPRVRPSFSRAESVGVAAGWTVPGAPGPTGRPVTIRTSIS